jgi:ribosomal protein S18 acetylase RimI-like enzyme
MGKLWDWSDDMSVEFGVAGTKDVETLMEGMRGLYGASKFKEEPTREALSQLIADPTQGQAVLILSDGKVAGYMVITLGCSLEFGGTFALLDEIYVWPEYRGRGLGAAAIGFTKEFCRQRGFKAVRLEVQRDNAMAQRLYRKAGFFAHDRELMSCWVDEQASGCAGGS